MKTVKGDLVKLAKAGVFNLIIHGCNCFNTMGAGVARQIRNEYPEAYEADCATARGDINKLGNCSVAQVGDLIIINAYTQYRYGRDKCHTDYNAIWRITAWIAENYPDKRIGYPCIGAGLAGGNWAIIKPIFEQQFKGLDHTLVKYQR